MVDLAYENTKNLSGWQIWHSQKGKKMGPLEYTKFSPFPLYAEPDYAFESP